MSPEQVQSLMSMRFGSATAEKMTAIKEAKAYKTLELEKFQQSISAATAQSDADKNSWVGKLGLDPTGVTAGAVNMGANVYSGLSRVAGDIATTVTDAYTYANEGSVSEDNIQRYNRYTAGTATPEDLAVLNAPTPSPDGRVPGKNELKMASPMELLTAANASRKRSTNIDEAFDQTGVVHQANKNKLAQDIGSDFDGAWDQTKKGYQQIKDGDVLSGMANLSSGGAKLAYNAGDAVASNKQGTLEYVAENVPQLAIGGVRKVGGKLLLASNAGYASDFYRKGITKYQEENNGAYPPEEMRKEMAAGAIRAGAAEHAGDLITGGISKVAKSLSSTIASTSFKQSLLGAAKATGLGIVNEGITEAYQTVQEGVASLTPVSDKEIYTAGVIGAASGGVMSGSARTAAEIAQATPEHVEVRQQEAATKAEQSATFRAAADSNDPSPYLDAANPTTYDPSMAIGVLAAHANLETTTPEVKAANLEQAGELLTSIEEEHAKVKERVESYSPESVQYIKDQIAQVETAMQTADPSKVSLMQDTILIFKADLAALGNKEAKSKAEVAFSKIDRQLSSAQLRMEGMTTTSVEQVTPDVVQATVQAANVTPESTDDTSVQSARTATDSVINLSMRADSSLSAKDALDLAGNTTNSLAPEERQHLKTFAESRQAQDQLSNMGRVSQAVLTGDGKDAGITTWVKRMASATATGNKVSADKAVVGITKFAEDHEAKFIASVQAHAAGVGASVQRIQGKWEMVPAGESKVSMSELRAQKGLVVGELPSSAIVTKAKDLLGIKAETDSVAKFKKLVNALEIESYALNKAQAEIKSTYGIKFGVQSVSSANQTTPSENISSKQTLEHETRPDVTNVTTTPTTPETLVTTTLPTTAKPSMAETVLPAEPPAFNRELDAKFEAERLAKQAPVTAPTAVPVKSVAYNAQYLSKVDEYFVSKPETFTTENAVKHVARLEAMVSTLTQAKQADPTLTTKIDAQIALLGSTISKGNALIKAVPTVEQETAKQQDAEQSEASPVAADVTATTESNKDTKPDVLGIVDQVSKPEDKVPFNLRNLVTDHFSQKTESKTGTSRPLASVKDFLSVMDSNPEVIYDHLNLGTDEVITEEQDKVINAFLKSAKVWNKKITSMLGRTNKKEFRYKDMAQFFLNVEGVPDFAENVKTAISYATFNAVIDMVSKGTFNDTKAINGLLDKAPDALVSTQAYNLLANAGDLENVLRNSWGKTVVASLGLKVNPDAPQNFLPTLESSMGAHVAALLTQLGLVEQYSVSKPTYDAMAENEVPAMTEAQKEKYDEERVNFIRLVKDTEKSIHPLAKKISEISKGTQSILNKLLGTESFLKEPSLKRVKTRQTKAGKGDMDIPSSLQEVMDARNKSPTFLRQDAWNFISEQIDNETLMEIAGAEHLDNSVHTYFHKSIEAKNDGLQREINNLKEYVKGTLTKSAKGLGSAMFFEQDVWVQQRVGILTNMINPQSSKIHRMFLTKEQWETTVDLNDIDSMRNFNLRVAEGLGVKTDKKDQVKALEDYFAMVNSPEIIAAVDVLLKSFDMVGLTAAEQKTLVAGVKSAGQNMHSLDALMALAYQKQAEARGDTTFKVQLMAEIDGVTNGPMFSLLLYGAARTLSGLNTFITRGGFYPLGSGYQDHNVWRSSGGNLDLYEYTIGKVLDTVATMVSTGNLDAKLLASINKFTGELKDDTSGDILKAGRNIIKTPLTAMVFGSSIKSAVSSMADSFIDSVYVAMQATYNDEKGAMTPEQLVKELANLGVTLPKDAELNSYEFNTKEVATLQNSFTNSLGEAVKATMESEFAVYLEARNTFNSTARLTFSVYNTVYETMREEKIAELVASGEIEVNPTTGKPLHDLTIEQEEALRDTLKDLRPILHTAMSKASGELNAGLLMSKQSRKISQDYTYLNETHFAKGIPTATTRAYKRGLESPGVAVAPMSMHSFDSGVSQLASKKLDVLNNHDAHGVGVNNSVQAGTNLNEEVWNQALMYSPMSEMADSFGRSMIALSELINAGKLSDAVIKDLGAALTEINNKRRKSDKTPVGVLLSMAAIKVKSAAYRADVIRLGTLANLEFISQYAIEGGAYGVTTENRSEAASLRSALSSDLSASVTSALATVEGKLGLGNKAAAKGKPLASPSTFDQVGKPTIKADVKLESMFDENKIIPVSTVIAVLGGSNISEYSKRLLALVSKVIDQTMSVRLVTKDNVKDVLAQPTANSRAWYVSKDGQHEINVLSSDFKHSGLTSEVLIHELTHAALARTIDQAQRTGKGDVFNLVQELESLRKLASEFAKTNQLDTQYASALSSVQELVAWGMTNRAFQDDVLGKVQMETSNSDNRFVTGMKAFIARITALLFGKTNPVIQNGMTVLISNVSGLSMAVSETSTENTGTIVQSMTTDPDTGLNAYSTTDIYEALAASNNSGTRISAEHDTHLRSILDVIVSKLYGPYGSYKAKVMAESAVTPEEVYAEALATGLAPHASEAMVAGVHFSQEESFVFDQTEAVISQGLDNPTGEMSAVRKELNILFNETKARLKAKDFHAGNWATATPNEIGIAEAKYAFVFNITPNASGVSNHLARFAAMGLSNEQFNNALKVATAPKSKDLSGSIKEKLIKLFIRVLDWFEGKATSTYSGQDADAKLFSLVKTLAQIDQRKMSQRVLAALDLTRGYDVLDNVVQQKRQAVHAAVVKFAKRPAFKNHSSGFIRGASGLASAYGGYRLKALLETFERFRDAHFKGQQGLGAGLLNELRGAKDLNVVYHFMNRITKLNEGTRKDLITNTAQSLMSEFVNQGNNLTDKQKHAATQVFLRADLQSLIGDYTVGEVISMVNNPKALAANIATKEAELLAQGNTAKVNTWFINSAKAMAYRMVTGKATNGRTMMNPGVIARLYASGFSDRVTTAQSEAAEKVIDTLGSLYALSYVDSVHLREIKQVIDAEQTRTDGGNGLEALLLTHKMLQDKAKQILFADGDNDALFMKGYLPEVYDPYMAYVVANGTDGKDLLAQSYKKSAFAVPTDVADPNSGELRHFYSLRDGGLKPWLSGVMSYTGMRAKGTRAHNSNMDVTTYTGQVNAMMMDKIEKAKLSQIKDIFNNTNFDPRTVKETYMVPLLNANGDVVNQRYMMEDHVKDTMLDRDNRPEKLLGILAGNIYDKPVSAEQNRKAVQAMKSQYNYEFNERPEAYLELGPRSSDPQLRSIYNMLPNSTKQAVKEIWGTDTMMVRNDVLDLIFGYRKLSIADGFSKDAAQRNLVENMFVEFSTYAFGPKAALYARRGEDVWQAFVKLTKSNLVVRSLDTLAGNVISNVSQLALTGIPVADMLRDHRIALKGAWAYNKDSKELFSLEHQLSTGYISPGNSRADMEYRVSQLKSDIASNPIKPLIDAGLMPTIVEDISADQDPYTYKSKFTHEVDELVAGVNPEVVGFVKGVLMTEDSAPYKFMSFLTQNSDFLARYTLYTHLTTRKDNKLNHNEAVQYASDAFINYDLPTHRLMQYANDSGLMMFTKYYIRIQKMIGKIFKDNPGRAVALIATEHWMGNQPTVLDSSMLVRFGNPMNLGALDFPGSIDEIATVQLITAPFR